MSDSLIFGERPERFAYGRSFLVSDLSELLMVAHSLTSLAEQIDHFLNKKVYKIY